MKNMRYWMNRETGLLATTRNGKEATSKYVEISEKEYKEKVTLILTKLYTKEKAEI